jgi:hypothetical protein
MAEGEEDESRRKDVDRSGTVVKGAGPLTPDPSRSQREAEKA